MPKQNIKPKHKKKAAKLAKRQAEQRKSADSLNLAFWKEKKNLIALFSVILITFIVFVPAINNEFMNWDDDVNVFENPNVQQFTSESITNIFTSHVIGNYNPLPIFTFAIENHFFGLNPTPHHVTNIILHLICTILVFWFALSLGLKLPGALIVALLFGIHPMRVESVAWITERKDVLFGMFYIASLIAYIYLLETKKKRFYFIILILAILSMLSKIQAVTLPLSMLAVDYLRKRPLKLNLIIEKIPIFILSLVTGIVGIYFLGQAESLHFENYPFYERLLIGTYSLIVYITKAIFPYQLSALYPFPKAGELSVMFYLSPLILAGLIYLVIRSAKRTRVVVFGSLFFLFNIVFLLQVVGAGQGFIADRFTYIPYIGLFFIFGYGIIYIINKKPKLKWIITTGIIIYMIIFCVITWNRNHIWSNSETLWTDVLSKYKNVAVAYNNRGKYFREQDKYDLALADYNKCLSINPDGYNTYNNRGKIYFDQGNDELALADFNKCLELNPEFVSGLANRGSLYGKLGQYEDAVEDLNKALTLNPNHINSYSNRSLIYFFMTEYELATKDCDTYIKFRPDEADMYDLRGLCKRLSGKNNEAIADHNTAIRLDPTQGAFFLNRSIAYNELGDKAKAQQDALQAQRLGIQVGENYLESLKAP